MKVPLIGNPGSVVRCPKGVKSVGSAPDGKLPVFANEPTCNYTTSTEAVGQQAVIAAFFPPCRIDFGSQDSDAAPATHPQ
jgi:hypothetical protein